MKIDKTKLVDLLVEKTDMDKNEIEDQLDQLIDRILDAAKRGKALEIKEFGLFYFDEDGELKFDPSDELSTEISFKYAGMKPVELKPERDTSIPGLDEEEDDEDEYDEDDTEFAPFDPDDEDVEEEDTEEEPADILEDPFAPEALEPLEETEETEEKSTIENVKPPSRQPVRNRKDNTGLFVLVVIIIVAVLIGGYYYYIGSEDSQPPDTAMTSESAQQNTAQQDAQDTGSEEELESAGNEQGDDAETEEEQTPDEGSENQNTTEPVQDSNSQPEENVSVSEAVSISETNQSMYGLMGTVIEEANSGYSIVLHSFTSEDNAYNTAQRLRQDGYRVIVTSRAVSGSTMWRVSVGQFETLTDAQQATVNLPAPYDTQNFIHRIQIN